MSPVQETRWFGSEPVRTAMTSRTTQPMASTALSVRLARWGKSRALLRFRSGSPTGTGSSSCTSKMALACGEWPNQRCKSAVLITHPRLVLSSTPEGPRRSKRAPVTKPWFSGRPSTWTVKMSDQVKRSSKIEGKPGEMHASLGRNNFAENLQDFSQPWRSVQIPRCRRCSANLTLGHFFSARLPKLWWSRLNITPRLHIQQQTVA